MFIDEGLASFPFSRIKRVDLGNFGDKGVLEFNGVIKESMRGKNIVMVQWDPYPFLWSRDTKHMTSMQPGTLS